MSVKIYLPDKEDVHIDVLTALSDGIPDVEIGQLEEYRVNESPDIAIVFGNYKPTVPHTAFRGRVQECQKYAGKHTLIIERGYIKRDEYYAMGMDGLNGRADFRNANSPSDRWEKLEVELLPTSNGEHILICGQVPWDASVYESDHIEWLRETVVKVMELTDAPIRLRPHPLAIDNTPNFLGTEFSIGVSIDEDLAGAKSVITFNSNTGVDALIAGKPVVSFDEGSMVYNQSDHFLEMLNAPSEFDRQQWANDIAYAQWTVEEMRSGEAWEHISRGES